jgi:hypothetical protein
MVAGATRGWLKARQTRRAKLTAGTPGGES